MGRIFVILGLLVLGFAGLNEQRVTHQVAMDVSILGQSQGSIVIDLYGDIVPATAINFFQLCNGEYQLDGKAMKYAGSPFHRIIPGFMIQGGDFTNGDGTGGYSIYGQTFTDQNFILNHEPYCISMANAGKDTNGSQFFITTAQTPWLNGKYVVFGRVSSGVDFVNKISAEGSASGTPKHKVVVTNCRGTVI